MHRRSLLVRLVGSNLCLVAAALFCRVYGIRQMDAYLRTDGVDLGGDALRMARLLTAASPVMMLLPVVLVALGLRWLLRGPEGVVTVELVSQVALVLAFVLVVTCLLLWQLPGATGAVGVF